MSASKLSPTVVKDLCERYSHQNTNNCPNILSYSLKNASDSPTGFLGCHEILSVIIQTNPSETPKELVFFIKTSPNDIKSVQKYIAEFGVFAKEVCVYRDLLPKLQEGLPDFSARCYYAKDEILVFEHLGEMGFRMGCGQSGLLDLDHVKCGLSSLASLHASSIIFEAKTQQKLLEIFPQIVEENAYPSDENNLRRQNFKYCVGALCEIIKVMPEFKDSGRLEYILEHFQKLMNRVFDIVKPSKNYLNVFSHGDLWANNLLFKYENGRPVQCRLVDFQLTRYAPPILDVLTFLTIPTTQEFRAEHLDSLLDSYYSMLGYFLKQNGLDIKELLPRQQFEDSLKEFQMFGLIESCLYSHITVLPSNLATNVTSDEGFDEFFKIKRSEICLTAFNTDKVYRNRLSDMLSDLVNNYVLK